MFLLSLQEWLFIVLWLFSLRWPLSFSIYGLATSPQEVQEQIESLSDLLPQEAQTVINEQLLSIAKSAESALSFGAIGGLLLAIWSTSKGMSALITSLNIAYNEEETRGFFHVTGLALGLTIVGIIFVILTLFLITLLPTFLQIFGFGEVAQSALSLARWPLLVIIVMVGLALLYRYAPCRKSPQVAMGFVGSRNRHHPLGNRHVGVCNLCE